MRNTLAVARKEFGLFFTTPWAWIALTAMLAVSAFFFVGLLAAFQQTQAAARQYGWAALPPDQHVFRNLTDGVIVNLLSTVMVITLFVAPFLSMRLFAEERRQKTFELLMTAPVRPYEVVLGKYLGGTLILFATLAVTLIFPAVVSVYGSSQSGSALEWSTVLLGYGALFLFGATCMAVGMFISSLTESQALAAMVSFVVLLPWWLLGGLAQRSEEPVRSILKHLSFDHQLAPLFAGALDLKALVFFASVILFALFLTHRRLEAFRWA
jgi:ABC-2 type transport system permease protein